MAHAMSGFLAPLLNILISWWVVKLTDTATWGGFIDWRILIFLAISLIAWGNTDYLLRAFARNPAQMGSLWKKVFISRGILIFIALPLVLLSPVSYIQGLWLFSWLLAGMVSQSFQVAILYTRKFGMSIASDLLAFLPPAIAVFIWRETITADLLLQYFSLGAIAKALALGLVFRRPFLEGEWPGPGFKYFAVALPFFLHGMAGLLQSRVDLYMVSWILKEDELTGKYQILISLLVHLQALAGFILLPFVRNLYRLKREQIWKITRKLTWVGLVLVSLGIPFIYLVVNWGFGLDFGWRYYLWGGLLAFPVFCYAPLIYHMYKINMQREVVLVNAGGILFNIALNLSLIHQFQLEGALIASASAQWFTFGLVLFFSRKQVSPD